MAKNTKQISIDNTAFDFRPKGICSTIANNASKTVSITDFTLFDGATVLVKFENNNTAPYPTLNINDTGAKSIIGGNLTSGGIYEFMYDGTYWNIIKSDSSKNYHVIDLTSLSQDNFYPVIFNAKHYVNDCEIHSPNVAGTSAYNQNILHFQLHSCGYSDTPKSFKVLSYGTYSNLEITIGAVGYGHTTGEHCVWVRGGMKYEFICNIKPMLYADGYSNNEQIFMPGINYYGGENVKVTYCWSADNPRSEVLSEAATNTKLGGIKTGYTQSGKNYPVQLDSNNKAYVNVSWTDNDTKNTAGSTNNSSKLYLIGATEQSANPQTYSNSKVYATDGVLTATTFSGTATNADKLGGQLPAYYATAADYVKKSGDTMTGDLTIKRNSSDSPSIILQRAETDDTFEDWRMSNVSGHFKIQNRNSGNTWVDTLSLAPSATKTLTSSYSVLPSTNNTLTLGNSTYKWKDIYATNLNGTATNAISLTRTAETSVNNCNGDNILKYYTLSGCTATEATGNNRYAGTADSYGFPVSNNANGLLWLGNHSTNYGHQLGFSSDGNIYHRKIDNGSFPTTVNGGSWKQILAGVASSTNLGGIKIGYTKSGQNYPVQLSSDNKAYVNVPSIGTATTTNLGAILAADVRTTAISTTQGGTTSNRYYGVEVDSNGKAFVNVPWTHMNYILPEATSDTLGGIKLGYGLQSMSNGKVCVNTSNSTIGTNSEGQLQLGQTREWENTGNNLSNLNNFVDYGIYNISGEHTRNDDNLPINNIGGGNTFQGRLFVYDSSLTNTGNAGNCCITQVLTLSNRVGGDGNTYIRTGVGSTKSSLTWGTWGKHQTNVEVGVITQSKMNELIDNGIYSGALSDTYETFVLVCINNYAIAAEAGVTKSISHLLYSIDLSGNVKVRTRNNTGNIWSEYKELGSGNNSGNTSSSNFSLRIGSNAYHSDSAALNLGSDANSPEGVLDILTMLPANTNNIGGIKAAGVRTTAISTTQGGITGNRYYGVEVDSNGKAFVNVPWTTYTASSVAYAITYKTLSSGSVTLTSLAKETITRISTSTTAALTELTGTITLSSFASKNSNKITTYGLQFKVGTSGSPKLVVPSSVKWANGIEPILTGGEIIDILFTTLDGSIYTATWTKYF